MKHFVAYLIIVALMIIGCSLEIPVSPETDSFLRFTVYDNDGSMIQPIELTQLEFVRFCATLSDEGKRSLAVTEAWHSVGSEVFTKLQTWRGQRGFAQQDTVQYQTWGKIKHMYLQDGIDTTDCGDGPPI